MAKRTLHIEIITTKFTKEFLSQYHEYIDFIGNIQFIFNGIGKNEYAYYKEGIIRLAVDGALRYHMDHGFDFTKTNYFDRYTYNGKNKSHVFTFSIDENKWTVALKYGTLIKNKITNTVTIPSGKDVYKIRFDYAKNFNPELILVQSYKDMLLQQQFEINEKNKQLSNQLFTEAQLDLGKFSHTLNQYFIYSLDEPNHQEVLDKLNQYLTSAKKNVQNMPQKHLWTTNWQNYIEQIELQYKHFFSYIFDIRHLSHSKTLFREEYGKIHEETLKKAKQYSKNQADTLVDTFIKYYDAKDWLHFCDINVNEILYILWFYATYKPFDTHHFEKATRLFNYVYRTQPIEPFLAKCYAMIQVGTEDAINDMMRSHLETISKTENLSLKTTKINELHKIAPALMWMKAYKEEERILQYMLQNSILMNAKEQERLYLLSTSKGMDLTSLPSHHSSEDMNIRMDSINWNVEDYRTFFDNLSFQDKKLSEYLAIRDELQDIVLNAKIKFPSLNEIANKMKPMFEEEYGDVVKLSLEKVCCISLDESEEMEGIFAITDEVQSLGIFTLCIRIGKKLNIKFYTLYLPENTDVEQQAKKAISMFKKSSPTVSMWESSLKGTFLSSMQQILNSSSVETKTVKQINEF